METLTLALRVRLAQSGEDKQAAFELRQRVFCDEQGFSLAIEYDKYDQMDSTLHFLGYTKDSDTLVAVARAVLLPPSSPTPQNNEEPAQSSAKAAKLGRIAILASCRGKGYGSQLMDAVEQLLKQYFDVSESVLNAQFDKKGFYEKCGYQWNDGVVFQEEGVDHCRMVKQLA